MNNGTIKTIGRFPDKWVLDLFGMTSKVGRGNYRHVTRAEIRRLFELAASTTFLGTFTGSIKNGSNTDYQNKWNASLQKGRLSLGCQTFDKATTKRLREWATGRAK